MKKSVIAFVLAGFALCIGAAETHEVKVKQETTVQTNRGVLTVQKYSTMDVDENNNIVEFIPAKNSTVKIGNQELKLKNGGAVKLSADGKILQLSIDITDSDVDINGIKIFAKNLIPVIQGNAKTGDFEKSYNELPTWLTLDFYENGTPKAVRIYELKNASDSPFGSAFNNSYFYFQLGTTGFKAKKVTFTENFSVSSIELYPALKMAAKTPSQFYEFTELCFSPDSKKIARAGVLRTKSDKGSFFDKGEGVLIVYEGSNEVSTVSDKSMKLYPEITWNENNLPATYTAEDENGNLIVKEVQY